MKKQKETLTLTRVLHQKEGERVCDFLTNLSLNELITRNAFLSEKDRKIIEIKTELITINDNKNAIDYFENGILHTQWVDSNPNSDDDMEIKLSDIAESEDDEENANFFRNIGQ